MQNTNETIIQSGLYSRLSQARYIAKGQGMKKENKLSHTRGVFQHGPGVYDFIHVYGWLENLTSLCILHKTRNYNNSEIRTAGKRHRKRWTRKTKRNKDSYEVHISHSHLFKSWNQYSLQNTLLIRLIWKKKLIWIKNIVCILIHIICVIKYLKLSAKTRRY